MANPLKIQDVYNVDLDEDFVDEDIDLLLNWQARKSIPGADDQGG